MRLLTVLLFYLFTVGGVFAQNESGIEMSGEWGYQLNFNNNTIKITGDKIENNYDYKSGTIKLVVFITDDVYSDINPPGLILAEYKFDPLEAGYYYYDIEKKLNFKNVPPPGDFYVSFIILQYGDGDYWIQDYLNFDGTQKFPNTNIADNFWKQMIMNQLMMQQMMGSYSGAPSSGGSSGMQQNTCPYCNGTGDDPYPSYVASFGLTVYKDEPCPICGKLENHYHKNCSQCQGTGYIMGY